jgi:hypothetical protein
MKLVRKLLSAVGAVSMLAFASGASAAPVVFNITNAQFVTGFGYGIDLVAESDGTLLDVRFLTNTFSPQNFALSAVNQSFSFNFGTIALEEQNRNSGILPEELDDLGIAAKLTFAAPAGVTQTITATGVATPGSVSDSQVDYLINWSPVTILFGNGGSFQVSLTDMSFSDIELQIQTATVTLLSLPVGGGTPPDTSVPEPASLALVGIGIGGLALTRRRHTKVSPPGSAALAPKSKS